MEPVSFELCVIGYEPHMNVEGAAELRISQLPFEAWGDDDSGGGRSAVLVGLAVGIDIEQSVLTQRVGPV